MTQEDAPICMFQLDEELILQNTRDQNNKCSDRRVIDKIPLKKMQRNIELSNIKKIKTLPRKIVVGFYVLKK